MIYIDNTAYIDIRISGLPLGQAANLFGDIILVENVTTLFPTARLVLSNQSDILKNNLAFSDANPFTVCIGKSVHDSSLAYRKYLLYGKSPSGLNGYGENNCLPAYAAYPMYMSQSHRGSYYGTSDSVIAQIAQECGLTYSGPMSTNGCSMDDKQVWLNSSKSRALFVKNDVATHAYADQRSAMFCTLTSLGELRYRNIMDVAHTPVHSVRHSILHNASPSPGSGKEQYIAVFAETSSKAGLLNNYVNYGAVRAAGMLSGDHDKFDSIDVGVADGKYVLINEDVSKHIDKVARIDYGSLDCGNTHPNYYRAFDQNQRMLALFTEYLVVTLNVPSSIQLLDPVEFRYLGNAGNQPAEISDVYVVMGKTIMVRDGTHYAEKITLARMTTREPGMVNLIGGGAYGNAQRHPEWTNGLPQLGGPAGNQFPGGGNQRPGWNPGYGSQGPGWGPGSQGPGWGPGSHQYPNSSVTPGKVNPVFDANRDGISVYDPRHPRNRNPGMSNFPHGMPPCIINSNSGVYERSRARSVELGNRVRDLRSQCGNVVVDMRNRLPILDGAYPGVSGLGNVYLSGTLSNIPVSLNVAFPSMGRLTDSVIDIDEQLSYIANSYEDSFALLGSMTTQNGTYSSPNVVVSGLTSPYTSIANTMFHQQGGPTETVLGMAIPFAVALGKTSSIYATSVASIPGYAEVPLKGVYPGLTHLPSDVCAGINQLESVYLNLMTSLARIWNTIVSTNYPYVPVEVTVDNWSYLIEALTICMSIPRNMTPTSHQISSVFIQMASTKNNVSKPKWVTTNVLPDLRYSVSRELVESLLYDLKVMRNLQYSRSTFNVG